MLKLVRLALARPYTFIVLALLILIAGPLAALRTPTDIFPDIRIPVISVVWNYAGLQPADMAGRIVTYYERTLGDGQRRCAHRVAIVPQLRDRQDLLPAERRHPHRDRAGHVDFADRAQADAAGHHAAADPQLQRIDRARAAAGADERHAERTAARRLRDQRDPAAVAVRRGVAIPSPYGGKVRQVQIDLDPQALQAKGCPRRMSRPRWRSRTRSSRPARRRSAASSTTSGSTTAR